MSSICIKKILAGVIGMTLAGTALANDNLALNVTTGDLFLNIVDTTSSTSFLFDTGISQAAFNGASSYSFNLSSDSNLSGFLNNSDSYNFSVISATLQGSGAAAVATVDFTGGANPNAPTPATLSSTSAAQAQSAVKSFLSFADTVSTPTTNTAVIPTGLSSGGYWGQGGEEGVLSNKLFGVSIAPYADNAALGTPLSFFQAVGTTLTTFAGTWNFSSATDTLSYLQSTGGGAPPPPVPLPAPFVLLVSGLGWMAVTRIRRRAATDV